MIRDFVGALTLVAQFLAMIAYWPQIRHLLQAKSSQGMSVIAWALWVFSSAMLLVYGIVIRDVVLIISQSLFTILNITVLILMARYRGR